MGYPAQAMNLRDHLGPIDIYLLDQLLKGRLLPGMSLLDAGCGSGRNLVYFLRNGYEVYGVDESPQAVEQVRRLARELAPEVPPERFRVSDLAEIPFPANRFDAVVCSAVLHFSRDEGHFDRMLAEMWRVLKPGGLFFARLASTIGVERLVQPLQGRWPSGQTSSSEMPACLRRWRNRPVLREWLPWIGTERRTSPPGLA